MVAGISVVDEAYCFDPLRVVIGVSRLSSWTCSKTVRDLAVESCFDRFTIHTLRRLRLTDLPAPVGTYTKLRPLPDTEAFKLRRIHPSERT
jgi:hypothetical protein